MNAVVYVIVAAVIAFSSAALTGNSDQSGVNENMSGPHGPAPNSHDGFPDGSGNDAPFGPVNGG
ncbi:hypothetical protein ACFLTH_06265 [Bacteroidota bacterium]